MSDKASELSKEENKQEHAFFGRRKGRPLRQKQDSLFTDMLPMLKIDLNQPAPGDLKDLFTKSTNFPCQVSNVKLEIGFGGGEHLLHAANRKPDTGFIGIEPFINGMAKVLAELNKAPEKASNIRLYNDDALQVLNWLPNASLSGIDIFYPDPWPKKKHWKRRFINPENLKRFARVLKSDGILRFASDIDTYINQVLQLTDKNPNFTWIANKATDWQTPFEAWPGTRYEAKAKREGRTPAYLTFIRQ